MSSMELIDEWDNRCKILDKPIEVGDYYVKYMDNWAGYFQNGEVLRKYSDTIEQCFDVRYLPDYYVVVECEGINRTLREELWMQAKLRV